MRTLQTELDCLFLTVQLNSNQCDGDIAVNSRQVESALCYQCRERKSRAVGGFPVPHKKHQVVAGHLLKAPSQDFIEVKASFPILVPR